MSKVVIGVIGSDVHAVGNKIIEFALKASGLDPINVGVLSTQEDFIEAAIESGAKAIIVSSLYGHGELDCEGFRDKCNESGLKDIILYVGGNIVVGKQKFEPVEKRFLKMGFNRVFPPGTRIEETIVKLKEDMKI